MPGLVLAGMGFAFGLAAGAGFGAKGDGTVAAEGSATLATGCACQTWPHFEQRTLRPWGGKAALTS